MASSARELQGAWNFRDVADSTGALRPGRLFRSGELSGLDDDGRDGYAVWASPMSPICARAVRCSATGRAWFPTASTIHLLPIPISARGADPDGDAPHEHAFRRLLEDKADDEPVSEASTRYMIDEYSRISHRTTARSRRCIASSAAGRRTRGARPLFRREGPHRLHGGAGARSGGRRARRDRGGFPGQQPGGSPAAGPDPGSGPAAVRRRSDAGVDGVHRGAAVRRGLGVREEYLDTARRTIDENFGSLDGYLRSAGITEADVTGCAARCWLRSHQTHQHLAPTITVFGSESVCDITAGVDITRAVKLQNTVTPPGSD